MNILLAVTGSIACTLTPKLVAALSQLGTVRVMLTASAMKFNFVKPIGFYQDEDEWTHGWQERDGLPSDGILHIELRKWADILVIAPLTANTLAKISLGLADNLVTNVARAWDEAKPVIVAPAMNTHMWNSVLTKQHLINLHNLFEVQEVGPISKKLACGDEGVGAMAPIQFIVEEVEYYKKRDEDNAYFAKRVHWK